MVILFHLNVGALEMREEKREIHLERGEYLYEVVLYPSPL